MQPVALSIGKQWDEAADAGGLTWVLVHATQVVQLKVLMAFIFQVVVLLLILERLLTRLHGGKGSILERP